MYSVVLMAALTAGTSTPTWGWGSCHGCHGFFGGCFGCFGGCRGGYGGCYGGASYGGACYGGACYGGYGGGGSCYGCYGGYSAACYGGYGAACYGGYGAACYGCHGGTRYAPSGIRPGAPTPERRPEPVPAPKKEDTKSSSLGQARLIVELPADAKLYVDDQLMKSASERRVFNTPSLEEGQTYYYILRAEVVRDGKKQSESKRVLVHAGEVIRASFPESGDVTTTARAEARAGR